MERFYPRFIVIHHTAGHDVSALQINRIHAARGFGVKITEPLSLVEEYRERGFPCCNGGVVISIGYHYLIRADGSVEKGRPDFAPGAHCTASGMNMRSIGIALTGNFSSRDNPSGKKGHPEPTAAQLKALKKLVSFLMDVYSIPPSGVLGHSKVPGARTECPGDRFVFSF
ncbi:peptidoglycan recognition protein family protein [Thermosediminibacter oceani]|uniref:N-acetylmuramoyl-L-alanine amidase family 2 n=1 Tax=Thermosediminibacter oceani (strain ATCC BAA-1034 / DSM 16646 / JW/IW-1228P) TaxID=555079 RepID=D9S1H5_THEOJ|nr:peptidoglycan recognition family protein [Thermosediminibacter oceani]ADL07252.1 N-acetylmuramoyl-L-alanine amidase family 2 [Thermosediminibacter oceani DSM 16646]